MFILTKKRLLILSMSVFMMGCDSSEDSTEGWYEDVYFEHPEMKACFIESAKTQNWSSVDDVTGFYCHHKDIDSIVGIEQFENLTDLQLGGTALKEINLSGNPLLDHVVIHGNPLLKSVDFSSNVELTNVYVYDNVIEEVNLSSLPKLHTAYFFKNRIKEINLDGTDIEFLNLQHNSIEEIDLSNARSIRELILSYNPLTQIDLSNLHDLRALFIIDTEVDKLDVSFNWELSSLSLMENKIENIRFDNNPSLTRVNIEGNPLDIETLDYLSTIDWIEDLSF
ncbi:leucine-rich repeat domain-containing protein [Shewanella donghaensis]|uniref:hypothetical protein n=1 Tax=Shewanella donghaensis TaxID=238836 RepID=UPI001182A958|nr:hypothetical protein [Shewanella donghaensis]